MADVNLFQAAARISSGDAKRVLSSLIKAAGSDSADYKVLYVLALAYQATGDATKAKETWREAAQQLELKTGHLPARVAAPTFKPSARLASALSQTLSPPHEPILEPSTPASSDELHDLINELEAGNKIPMRANLDLPGLSSDDELDGLVTETLARIHAAQGLYEEAAQVYSQLADLHPEDADRYKALAAAMSSRANAQESESVKD